jgi:hypothetical protein
MAKEIEEIIMELRDLADEECTCSIDQQTGGDSTVCKSCQASHIINKVGELLQEEVII